MEVLRSAPDGGGIIITSIAKSDSEKAIMLNLDCASAVQSGSPTITATTYLTIAVCKWVDASNFCVQLPSIGTMGIVVEVYAEGGLITIFPPSSPPGGPSPAFFDGSPSVSTSTGARFRSIISTDGSFAGWGKID